jgi:two-component system sensor histidine kinase KdpD
MIINKLTALLKVRRYHYLIAAGTVGLVALLCAPLKESENYHVVPYIFLFTVSILATFMRIIPVLIASTLSALVWNYFFIPPHYTFHIEKPEDILLFAMFFMIAMLNGVLTSRLKQQEELAREREQNANALYNLTSALSKAGGINELKDIAISKIKKDLSTDATIIIQDGQQPLLKIEEQKNDDLFRSVYIGQIKTTLEREYLAELAKKARFLDESDKLYKTLFNSISHELRIPVATIMGASESLLTMKHPGNIQSELTHEIFTASARLNRVIENLLNMSRLESGRISARLDWHDINDLVNNVIADLDDELKAFNLKVDIPEDMPLVKIDFGLMEQVLYNLMFNSCEHAPEGSELKLSFSHEYDTLNISLTDCGTGFPQDKIQNVFDKFFKVENSKSGGLGLGLSIVKGFVEAHNGIITVENRITGGAMFKIMIPSESPEITNIKS